ncbi:MAG: glutamate 5-kinase [Aquificae bacterium]|nr:glutamate 5-kinase [Aquificota bacterium]
MRIVFKIGSNLLQTEEGDIDLNFLSRLGEGIKKLRNYGDEVVVVSSGAVLSGAKRLGLKEKPSDLTLKQALSAVGQAYLMHLYDVVFSNYGLKVGQILLTRDVFQRKNEDRFRNAQRTLTRLLELGIVPIVNENDAVAVSELVFGDNDFLAVYVAFMVNADLLVIFSSAGGLRNDRDEVVREVEKVEEAFKFVRGTGTSFGTGGMRSKLEATRLATTLNIPVIITGKEENIPQLRKFKTKGTFFKPSRRKLRNALKVLATMEEPKGIVVVDRGAAEAIRRGKSLLPAGVVKVEGVFSRGDVVSIFNEEGLIIGKGKVNFSSEELEKIKGMKTKEVRNLLGTSKDEVIHRDNMVVF